MAKPAIISTPRAEKWVNHLTVDPRHRERREHKKWLNSVTTFAGETAPELAKRYNDLKKRGGRQSFSDAKLEVVDFMARAEALSTRRSGPKELKLPGCARVELDVLSSVDDIKDFCRAKARHCERLIQVLGIGSELSISLFKFVESYGITLTKKEAKKIRETPMQARLTDEYWWRRKIFPIVFRTREQLFREQGHVRRGRGCYVSDHTVRQFISRQRRNKNLLEALEATNERGEAFTVAEIAEKGMANPGLRRTELMVRARGFHEWAERDERDWIGLFITITCPSKYHLYADNRNKSGRVNGVKKNPKYNGSTPRDAQTYLSRVWAKIQAKCQREGIEYFGFRTCEPHHDGCPHWHSVLHIEEKNAEQFEEICRHYALQEDGEEPGAKLRRFTCIRHDPSKGTTVHYLAKYIAKGIDGYKVNWDKDTDGDGDEYTGLTGNEAALRVRAWATCWGIRQFQQIGGPPVTPYRELRRLSQLKERLPVDGKTSGTPEQLKLLLDAAEGGDWCDYTERQGGATGGRKTRAARIWWIEDEKPNRYGEIKPRIGGLEFAPEIFPYPIKTRVHSWTIALKNTVRSVWSRAVATVHQVVLAPSEVTGLIFKPTLAYTWEIMQGIAIPKELFLSGANAPPWCSINNSTVHAGCEP